ncbi:putative regulator of Ras-like GTPase activity (Roadblock/LC7/MglB family) [Streptomyces sp. SAI-208]|uniref:roadblock/LC7 domain-containing protein n=1 Tax=Streptomyces sp. SAI-208 TaxID=2940550 RepID=UPI0024770993|nr:roadblock/LC7 domain-containing protein [Streptomyces sp. SAI-208]MDH6604530.1 putative regulator of Ras-like GTPase activity (Roadblock/LC7/MglB family) [Streptomyces sp. SAI-208]
MTATRSNLNWILDQLVTAPHARHALVLSSDGLTVGASENVQRDLADQIAASVSGLQSLSRSGGVFVADEDTVWQQTMVQYADGFLFVIAAGSGTYLVASAGKDVDIAAFSYRMEDTVKRLSDALSVALRQPTE